MPVGTILLCYGMHLGPFEIPAVAGVVEMRGMPGEERRRTVLSRLEGVLARE